MKKEYLRIRPIVIILICVIGALNGKMLAQIKERIPAPEINLEGIYKKQDNQIPTLASLKGKIVLLDFWGIWCGPCVAQFPKYSELYNKYNKQGFEIIAISDDSKQPLENFLKGSKINFWIGRDADKKDFANYKIFARPQVYLVNRAGVIVFQGSSITEAMIAEVIRTDTLASVVKSTSAPVMINGGFFPGDDPVYNGMFRMIGHDLRNVGSAIEQFTIRPSLEKELQGYAFDEKSNGIIAVTYSGGNLEEIFQFFKTLSSPLWVKNNTPNKNRYDLIYLRKNESIDRAKNELGQSLQAGLGIKLDEYSSSENVNTLYLERSNENLKTPDAMAEGTAKLYTPLTLFVTFLEDKTKEYFVIDGSLRNIHVLNNKMGWKEMKASSAADLITFLQKNGIVIKKEKKEITLFAVNPQK